MTTRLRWNDPCCASCVVMQFPPDLEIETVRPLERTERCNDRRDAIDASWCPHRASRASM